VIPAILADQAPEVQVLAFTPLFANGYNLGALWLGHRRKLTANELARFTTMSEILANLLFCLVDDHSNKDRPLDTIKAMVRMLATWDDTVYHHSLRTVSWARATARRMGLNEMQLEMIGWGALLHDIGKLGIPKEILHKPGCLTEEEWKIVKLHPKMGAKMLEPIEELSQVKEIVLSHHEKFDGTGYPTGLSGNEIAIGARIMAVVDAYSAMTEERIYRRTFSHEEAVQEIRLCSGTHFDPQVTTAFLIQFE
jgi:putative nucleotidyltransferase with HDIG domain